MGRTDDKAEAPVLWPPYVKSQLTGKESDAEKDGRGQQRMRWLDIITNSMDMNFYKLREIGRIGSLVCCCPCCPSL